MDKLKEKNINEVVLTGMELQWCINKTLIDFNYIPEDIRQNIVTTYNEANTNNRMKLFNYFVEKKLTNLMECIEDF